MKLLTGLPLDQIDHSPGGPERGAIAQQEAAEVLGISQTTAKRWWAYARAWLYDEIQSDSVHIVRSEDV
jgi:hypothetical protein